MPRQLIGVAARHARDFRTSLEPCQYNSKIYYILYQILLEFVLDGILKEPNK
jgi:hypothetical protein